MKEYKDGKLISLTDRERGDALCNEMPCSEDSCSDHNDMLSGMLEEVKKKALLRLSTLCMQGEHCSKDMREKMEKWGLSEELQEEIIDFLTAERFIDEERYCRSFIHDKMEYNKWGPKKIEQALRMKGVPHETISIQLDAIEDEEWKKILKPLLLKKKETVKGRNDYDTTQRILRFAAGRGFPIGLALKCINEDDDTWNTDFSHFTE